MNDVINGSQSSSISRARCLLLWTCEKVGLLGAHSTR
jgi:hypothetical protein